MPELKKDLEIIEKKPKDIEKALFPRHIELGDNEDEFTNTIYNEIENAINDMGDLPAQKQDWVDLFNGDIPETDFPWVDHANVAAASAIIGGIVEGYHHKTMSTLFGGHYVWMARALPGADEKEAEEAQEYLHYVQSVQMKLEESCDDAIMELGKVGNVTGFLEWSYKPEKIYDLEIYNTSDELIKENSKPIDKKIEEGYVDIGNGIQLDKRYKPHLMKILKSEALLRQGLIDKVEIQEIPVTYNKIVEDFPKLSFIDWDDFFVSGGKDAHKDLNKARVVGHKLTGLRWETLKQRAWIDEDKNKTDNDFGIYFNLDKVKDAYPQTEPDKKITDKETYANRDYDIRTCLYRGDIDSDGYEELCVFSIEWEHKILIQADYFPYWHNKCNYIPFRFMPRELNKLFCNNIPKMLESLADEYDQLTNQQLDNQTLANTIQFEGIRGSSAEEEFEATGFYPGVNYWFDSYDEVRQMEIRYNALDTLQSKQELKALMELRAGYSQYFAGQTPAADPKAPASKTAMMLKEALTKVEDVIKRIKRGPLVEIAYQVWQLSYQYMSSDRDYGRSTPSGRFQPTKISRSRMNRHNLSFIPLSTSIKANRDLDKQLDLELITNMRENPQIFGMVLKRPLSVREIAETTIRNWGDEWASKLDKIMPSEEQVFEEQVRVEMEAKKRLAQEEEFKRLKIEEGATPEEAEAELQKIREQDAKRAEQQTKQPKT